MAMIPILSSPYRVFYLINYPTADECTSVDFNWNQYYHGNINNVINKTIIKSISAHMKNLGNFWSTEVKVTTKKPFEEVMTYSYGGSYNTAHKEYYNSTCTEFYRWDDVGDDIVSMIDDYYCNNHEIVDKLVAYADRIEMLDTILHDEGVYVDDKGHLRFEMNDLPYKKNNELSEYELFIEQSAIGKDYNIGIRDYGRNGKSYCMSPSELMECIIKSEKYDALYDRVKKLFDDPDCQEC